MRSIPAALAMLDRFPILIHVYMLIGSLAIACLIPLYSSYVVTELGEPHGNSRSTSSVQQPSLCFQTAISAHVLMPEHG